MQITESAANAIIKAMKSKHLNLKTTYLEIGVFDGTLGLSFTRTPMGQISKKGDLMIVVSSKVDTQGIVVDYGEVNGKKGLIFLGEENVNQSN